MTNDSTEIGPDREHRQQEPADEVGEHCVSSALPLRGEGQGEGASATGGATPCRTRSPDATSPASARAARSSGATGCCPACSLTMRTPMVAGDARPCRCCTARRPGSSRSPARSCCAPASSGPPRRGTAREIFSSCGSSGSLPCAPLLAYQRAIGGADAAPRPDRPGARGAGTGRAAPCRRWSTCTIWCSLLRDAGEAEAALHLLHVGLDADLLPLLARSSPRSGGTARRRPPRSCSSMRSRPLPSVRRR